MDDAVQNVAGRMTSGNEDIKAQHVQLMLKYDRLPELMKLAMSPTAAPVKQKQVAIALVQAGRHGEALLVTLSISNRAEAKNVALAVVQKMERGLGLEAEEWQFLNGVYPHLRSPQRRDVLEAMRTRTVMPLGAWAESGDDGGS